MSKKKPLISKDLNTKNDMINRMVDLFDEAIMSCYYGMIDENKENTDVTNYDKEKGRLNYYECYIYIIKYFLEKEPLKVDDATKQKIDDCLDAFLIDVEENGINTEEIRRALLLLDIKAFKSMNFALDMITPDATSIIMASLVDSLTPNKKIIEMMDFNIGVGNLVYTIINHSQKDFKLIGIDNHMLLASVATCKANMLMQDANIYYEDALAYLPSNLDIIVSDLASYDYENEYYHSFLYDKGIKYFPYLAIEHYLKIPKKLYAIYLIENTFFSQKGSQTFYEMLKKAGHIKALISLPVSFFQSEKDAKSLVIISNQPKVNVSTNIFVLPPLARQEEFLKKLEEITNFLKA